MVQPLQAAFSSFSGATIGSGCRARVGLAEIRVGATLPNGPAQIAQAEIGTQDLRKMLLNGQPYTADKALAAGILDEVVDADALQDRAVDMATQYAVLPPKTYASAKHQLRGPVIEAIAQATKEAAIAAQEGWFTDETKPAMRAMMRPS